MTARTQGKHISYFLTQITRISTNFLDSKNKITRIYPLLADSCNIVTS